MLVLALVFVGSLLIYNVAPDGCKTEDKKLNVKLSQPQFSSERQGYCYCVGNECICCESSGKICLRLRLVPVWQSYGLDLYYRNQPLVSRFLREEDRNIVCFYTNELSSIRTPTCLIIEKKKSHINPHEGCLDLIIVVPTEEKSVKMGCFSFNKTNKPKISFT